LFYTAVSGACAGASIYEFLCYVQSSTSKIAYSRIHSALDFSDFLMQNLELVKSISATSPESHLRNVLFFAGVGLLSAIVAGKKFVNLEDEL